MPNKSVVPENQSDRTLFISHRHRDKPIAEVLHSFVDRCTNKEVTVYRSTSPEHAPRVGEPLTTELKNQLQDSSVVLLVFTTYDEDWSYCMWECGIATDPDRLTRIVAIQFSDAVPAPLQDRVRVDARSKNDIENFVVDFLTSPDFFPGQESALAPRLSATDPQVKEYSNSLYESLRAACPSKGKTTRSEHAQLLTLEAPIEGIRKGEIPEEAKVYGNLLTMRMFNFSVERQVSGERWTWGHLSRQANRPEDQEWKAGLGRALEAASENRFLAPFMGTFASYHTGKTHQPVVISSELRPDNTITFRIAFIVRPDLD